MRRLSIRTISSVGKAKRCFAGHKRKAKQHLVYRPASTRIVPTGWKLAHVAEGMTGVSIARDGFHELIAE
jgi:hypothetical protein